MSAHVSAAIAGMIAVFSQSRILWAEDTAKSSTDFNAFATKLREAALREMEPPLPPTHQYRFIGPHPWKTGIVTTVFWIGGGAKGKGGSGASAWDPKWEAHYGGLDDPNAEARRDFLPPKFMPRLNPFYVALPYNDVDKGVTKPEAKVVIPWLAEMIQKGTWVDGQSVCRDQWVAIRNAGGKTCYAQWSDCGPFQSDHWQYVFGNEKPRPNVNGGAGLNVSPAVRDFLGLSSTDITDWKFVRVQDVPQGPWALYGENNSVKTKKAEVLPDKTMPAVEEVPAVKVPPPAAKPAAETDK